MYYAPKGDASITNERYSTTGTELTTRGASAGNGHRPRRSAAGNRGREQAPESTWRRIDLHLHTPASSDYQEPDASLLDILQRAEERGLDVVAFTDHNSVRGYATLWREIEDLELLEYLERLEPAEEARLAEYRRLLGTILLLPGFEFTATFGFHILAIFPERTSVRLMEHLLLTLGIPEDRFGSGEVGATSDVLRAYEILADHGALVIGAHVNSTHGIAMQGLRFGGQTKIAYTQDPHLHALEVTDLAVGGHRRSTARFFNGSKPEYPRRMHCIQGSDAHRLDRDPRRESNFGVGDRATEVLLPTVSFDALRMLFLSDEFDRTRPATPHQDAIDPVKQARAEGSSDTVAFHESVATKRTGSAHVLRDVVAFANTDGGTIYVGASSSERRPIAGVEDAAGATDALRAEIVRQVMPALEVVIDPLETDGKTVLAVRVPRGAERPYALGPGAILVRQDAETVVASRDQIVAMVRGAAPLEGARSPAVAAGSAGEQLGVARRGRRRRVAVAEPQEDATTVVDELVAEPVAELEWSTAQASTRGADLLEEAPGGLAPDDISPPSGVEIFDALEQDGVTYYTMRDLRNAELTHNVTRDTGRRLWRSAIRLREELPPDESRIRWVGDRGFWRAYTPRGGDQRYHLAYRGDGDLRMFYGVSGDGLDDAWRAVLPHREANASAPLPVVDAAPEQQPEAPPSPEAAPLPIVAAEPAPDSAPPADAKPARPKRTRTRTPRAAAAAAAP